MGYSLTSSTGANAATSTLDKLNPVPWIEARWADFTELWTKILGMEHEAASLAASLPPGTAHDAAVQLVHAAAALASLQNATQKKVETYSSYLGLGAIVIPVAVAGALAAVGAVMVYCFERYQALQAILDAIKGGTITPEQARNIPGAGGPLPDVSVLGGLGGGLLLGALGLLGVLWWLGRRRENPYLVTFGANPQPPGTWSKRVLSLDYIHDDDGQAYTHEFRPDVGMQALPDGSVRLYGLRGQELWRDF